MQIISALVGNQLIYLPSTALAGLNGDVDPATVMLDELGEELQDFGEERQGLGGEPYLYLAPSCEADVNAALRSAGHSVTRDDSAILWK